jgi:putative DNA methylase
MTATDERSAVNSADAHPVKVRKKLIEVALPLEAINKACVKEKSIRHGHPSTLHLWWARRPLAAARAVIFSQMVDDPSEYVDVLRDDPKLRRRAETALKARLKLWEEAKDLAAKADGTGLDVPEPGPEPTLDEILADQERQRLFRIIENLVVWENTTNEAVLQPARDEIWASWRRACLDNVDHPRAKELFDRHKLPAFHDPFAGGGALPLEAQRLGLEAYASDLNPVAVLINKAMIEIPPKFAGNPPVNPESRRDRTLLAREWLGAQGLAEDVRFYGQWMREEAQKRIGHLYPKVEVTAEMGQARPDLKPYVGRKVTVIAWLWARTVKSPNPAFAHVDVPLASTFMLSTKAGKEAHVEPVIEEGGYRFTVKLGKPKGADVSRHGTKLAGANFICVMSGAPIGGDYIKAEGQAGHLGARLMAIVAEGNRGRIYLPPTSDHETIALTAEPKWKPDVEFFQQALGFRVGNYGMTKWSDLFTDRQLVALTTLSDLVLEARERVQTDARVAGLIHDALPLRDGGTGSVAYADAVATYLAFALDKGANYWSSVCAWSLSTEKMVSTFGRQVLPMVWDYCEANPLSDSSGNWSLGIEQAGKMLEALGLGVSGRAVQADAASQTMGSDRIVSTDPPYYDNIGYADLSDFFYVWMRRSQQSAFPDLFATVSVPKVEELVATPARHGGRAKAEAFFLHGMTEAMQRLAEEGHEAFPVTIYYAFKQAETDSEDGTTSTGWDTFLAAVIRAGFAISGTWPIRTEYTSNLKTKRSALASSIVLVCRRRAADAPTATRREFVAALKSELPEALANLQRGNIAPVDLAQAAIGPGMAVYTGFAKVLDADGKELAVREALALINRTLDDVLAEQEGDFDAESRWALAWYEQFGFAEGEFGLAETLSTAKVTSVAGMVESGIVWSRPGKVRLLKPSELDPAWDPAKDPRRPAWQAVHQLILAADRGENALSDLIVKLGPEAEIARELAYRLYVLSERKKRTEEALWYNGLVQSWTEAVRIAAEAPAERSEQGVLFGGA